jgi:hypothetical protein
MSDDLWIETVSRRIYNYFGGDISSHLCDGLARDLAKVLCAPDQEQKADAVEMIPDDYMSFKTDADASIWEAVKLILETHDIEKVSIDNKYSSFIPVGFCLVPKEDKEKPCS